MIFIKHLTYLFSIFIFAGTAVLLLWRRESIILKRYERIILYVVSLATIWTYADYFSTHWGAWAYIPGQTLNLHFLTEIETYLFDAAVAFVIGGAALIFALHQDRTVELKKNSHKRRSTKPRRV